MAITDYHAKYLAYELTRQAPSNSMEKLAAAVAGAQVDLNPHQVDAALFAFSSPLSKGALLADEVGLGKTIEAGLVLSQHWAEMKRRLLIICPANLRKQWHQELSEKFFLQCRILEKKSFDTEVAKGRFNPFDDPANIVICSYDFAKSKASYVKQTPWDLIVIDEAHRLRNVYKPTNKVANIIKEAILPSKKLLLTATPLQNSLLELYGLISIIDEHAFGDVQSFRDQFVAGANASSYKALRERLQPMSVRKLRYQVKEYVPYTNRLSMLEKFTPSDEEDTLYELVDEYLARPNLQALPSSQRSLITMTLRKLLASSSFAIAGALTTMSDRLKKSLDTPSPGAALEDDLAEDIDGLDNVSDEWSETDESPVETEVQRNRAVIAAEIRELDSFTELATSIETNAKGDALLKVLSLAMDKVAEEKAPRKAIIFTESRRTQSYLLRILSETQWKDRIVLFNGSNNDLKSREIFNAWMARHKGSDRIVDSKAANMRQSLVDYFREEGQIMIATEAAAEGINLQFCSLVVNYDLPWNPQRIEQRIGRCHRYGQKHDVVVLNFLNTKNRADERVYELLDEKFKLISGVFGASDDPLGAIESGVDFEKRILRLYQNARSPEAIEAEFRQLQIDLAPQIDATMAQTKRNLLENFDDEVSEKLRIAKEQSTAALNRFERMLMQLTAHELRDVATFDGSDSRFDLRRNPYNANIDLGLYELPRRREDAHIYRLNHDLAAAVIDAAKSRELPLAEVTFTRKGNVSALDPYLGSGGALTADLLTVLSMDRAEQYLLLTGVADNGDILHQEHLERMLAFPATAQPLASLGEGRWGESNPSLCVDRRRSWPMSPNAISTTFRRRQKSWMAGPTI
jgi:ERCC4-related helicase